MGGNNGGSCLRLKLGINSYVVGEIIMHAILTLHRPITTRKTATKLHAFKTRNYLITSHNANVSVEVDKAYAIAAAFFRDIH